jgi:hypothetical protein
VSGIALRGVLLGGRVGAGYPDGAHRGGSVAEATPSRPPVDLFCLLRQTPQVMTAACWALAATGHALRDGSLAWSFTAWS